MIFAQNSLYFRLYDSGDIRVKFIVLSQHINFSLELCRRILSFHKLILLISHDIFMIFAASLSFVFGGGFLQSHDSIDIVNICIVLGDSVFCVDGVCHHEEEIALFVLFAKCAIHRGIHFFFLHYKLLSKQINRLKKSLQSRLILYFNQQIQLMSKVRADPFPGYQTAGLKKETFGISAQMCLQPAERNVQTPEGIQKYRKSYKQQCGVTINHYGLVGAPLPSKEFSYGVPTEKSEGSQNVLKAGHKQRIGAFINDLKESKYDSLKKEPLAKTINRNYNMPQVTNEEKFKFGLPTEDNKYGAKQTIYSAENMPQTQQIRKLYLKSHKDYDPGQQKQRPYNWPVDPTDFRFGLVEKNPVHNEIKQILSPEAYSDNVNKTVFVKSNLHDFIDRKQDKLGQNMNLGQKQFPPERVFGVRVEPNAWDAGRCIRGQSNEYEVRPDDDLGRTNKFGFRNITKEGDQNRAFGVSTIRYDIPKPLKQSVADPNNYADETTAVELLFPKDYSSLGIGQEDYTLVRPKQEIKEMFQNIGFQFRGNIFNTIFERAKVIQGTILNKVSCNSFKQSIYEMTGR